MGVLRLLHLFETFYRSRTICRQSTKLLVLYGYRECVTVMCFQWMQFADWILIQCSFICVNNATNFVFLFAVDQFAKRFISFSWIFIRKRSTQKLNMETTPGHQPSPINLYATEEEPLSPIQQFYDNCNVFITGGTGFLGKSEFVCVEASTQIEINFLCFLLFSEVLVNKLLTSCSSLDTIYLLVRNKKGKDVHSRVEDIFNDPVSVGSANHSAWPLIECLSIADIRHYETQGAKVSPQNPRHCWRLHASRTGTLNSQQGSACEKCKRFVVENSWPCFDWFLTQNPINWRLITPEAAITWVILPVKVTFAGRSGLIASERANTHCQISGRSICWRRPNFGRLTGVRSIIGNH